MTRYNKIFFQGGPVGDTTGWGDLVTAATNAGIPVFAASSDSMTMLYDLQVSRQQTGVPHQGNFIPTLGADGNRFDFDQNWYPSREAALQAYDDNATWRWTNAEPKIPPELDKTIIAISLENEQNHVIGWDGATPIPGLSGWADSYGWQAYYSGLEALRRGYRYFAFSFAGGNPDEGFWEADGILKYLRLCEQHPAELGVALHEYSFTLDLQDGWGYKIGRFLKLHETCDAHGIRRPDIMIKEFGWAERDIPDLGEAMRQLPDASTLYAQYDNIIGAAIWTAAAGWGNASRDVPKLIPLVNDYTLSWRYEGEVDPDPTPPDGELGDAITPYNRTYWRVNQEASLQQWLASVKAAYPTRGTVGLSNDDAGIGVGLSHKKIIEVGGEFDQGVIEQWYEENYGVTDVVHIDYPENPDTFDFYVYPVDAQPHVNQHWGANPDDYEEWDLPGHDGVDLYANRGTRIFAVASGQVYRVEENPNASNYGIHVRIRHQDGYKTIYAHLEIALVGEGEIIQAGTIIGLADSTGNSTGHHLHLSLKREGYTYEDQFGIWPYNLHNPEPYLAKFFDRPPQVSRPAAGLHFRADVTMPLTGEYQEGATMKQVRPPLVKLMQAHPEGAFHAAIDNIGADAVYIVRIFQSWGGRNLSPQQFVNDNLHELKQRVNLLMTRGVSVDNIWVEVHNEPNLKQEGWTYSWNNGQEFAQWSKEVVQLLKPELPRVKYLYPGLSPGWDVPDVRYDDKLFFAEGLSIINSIFDGVGVHAYWSDPFPVSQAYGHVEWIRINTNLPLLLTEVSRNDRPATKTPQQIGREYADFTDALESIADIIGVAFFCGSSSGEFESETFVTEQNEVKGIGQAFVDRLK
jgi:murein DD-endopeptidase MepM/ murein hydrolase activator NlpD